MRSMTVASFAFLGGELRPQDQGPIVEPFADDVCTELVGGGLQRRDIVNGEKGIVDLAKADLRLPQLLLDETVTIEVIAGLEREERGHPHDNRAENLVADVEIIVRETAALRRQDPVIGIRGGVFRHADAKGGALLHAPEDKVNTVGLLLRQAALPGQDMIFLAYSLFGPLDREPMIAGVGFYPGLVVGGALAQDPLADRRNADHVAEEVHHLRGPRQAAEVTVNDNAVKAVVDESEQVTEQQGEQFHGSAPRTRQGSQTIRRGPGQQIVASKDFRLADEVRYIQRHAANHHRRIVTIGQLVLFSTETGDAWLLDRADRLAARLPRY